MLESEVRGTYRSDQKYGFAPSNFSIAGFVRVSLGIFLPFMKDI